MNPRLKLSKKANLLVNNVTAACISFGACKWADIEADRKAMDEREQQLKEYILGLEIKTGQYYNLRKRK